MEENVQHCYFCKNRCPLSAPKCDAGKSLAITMSEALAKKASQTCRVCEKRCPLDALGCSLGETIHDIKTKRSTGTHG